MHLSKFSTLDGRRWQTWQSRPSGPHTFDNAKQPRTPSPQEKGFTIRIVTMDHIASSFFSSQRSLSSTRRRAQQLLRQSMKGQPLARHLAHFSLPPLVPSLCIYYHYNYNSYCTLE
jgi:hypothetical protein